MVPRKPAEPDPHRLLPLPVTVFHILVALADDPRHGYAIMRDVAERTGGKLKLSPGTLYGAIQRMLEDGSRKQMLMTAMGPGFTAGFQVLDNR